MRLPSELKDYMKAIADELGISFEYGNSRRIINRQSANLDYPVLWLEKPTVRRAENGGYKVILSSGFAVLKDTKADDWDDQDKQQDECYKLTERILMRMENSAQAAPPEFEFDKEKCVSDMIEFWSGDCDTGWRTAFQVTILGGCNDSFFGGAWGSGQSEQWSSGEGSWTSDPEPA